jgi:hypothetical protein
LRGRAGARHIGQRDKGRTGDRGGYAYEDAEPADERRNPVGGDAHRGVGDGEDRLIQHQDEDDVRRRDPDLRAEFWEIDHISGPAQREHQLQDREIHAGAIGGARVGRHFDVAHASSPPAGQA